MREYYSVIIQLTLFRLQEYNVDKKIGGKLSKGRDAGCQKALPPDSVIRVLCHASRVPCLFTGKVGKVSCLSNAGEYWWHQNLILGSELHE